MPSHLRLVALLSFLSAAGACAADEPLHDRIDALITAKAKDRPVSAVADDAEFLRRVSLDLAGRIPSAADARAFLDDKTPDKRARLIDKLLASPDYSRRMQEWANVLFMERLGDNGEWTKYLQESFAANKPWDKLCREILRADPADEAVRGAAFFYAQRLDHYGENPIDYAGLTRDVGRLFLGKDFRCCQCHDHLFIDEYKQQDFQGLFAYFRNAYLVDLKKPMIGEKPTTEKVAFASVFTKVPRETGPRLLDFPEAAIPALKKGEEYERSADAKTGFPGALKFSPLARLAEQLPTAENTAFTHNAVNRLWMLMIGRGLVHPPDLSHAGNPPSHPELLDLLAKEFVEHKFDVKWLLRELALTKTYQRSTLLPDGMDKPEVAEFLTANEKRLSAEQLLASILEATGEKLPADKPDALRAKFIKAFANPPREAEDAINPSLKAALFLLNDEAVLNGLKPHPGNLIDRLAHLADDKIADELYLSVLTRPPTAEERADVGKYLAKHAGDRPAALGRLAWSLLASTEFCVNH